MEQPGDPLDEEQEADRLAEFLHGPEPGRRTAATASAAGLPEGSESLRPHDFGRCRAANPRNPPAACVALST
ncbi:hypothetical protein JCM13580A_11020 [Streptomyces drozdowiczii]